MNMKSKQTESSKNLTKGLLSFTCSEVMDVADENFCQRCSKKVFKVNSAYEFNIHALKGDCVELSAAAVSELKEDQPIPQSDYRPCRGYPDLKALGRTLTFVTKDHLVIKPSYDKSFCLVFDPFAIHIEHLDTLSSILLILAKSENMETLAAKYFQTIKINSPSEVDRSAFQTRLAKLMESGLIQVIN